MADYLMHLTDPESSCKLDDLVIQFLQLEDPVKKAYHLFIAGLTYSIYSDSEDCTQYTKRKMMKE